MTCFFSHLSSVVPEASMLSVIKGQNTDNVKISMVARMEPRKNVDEKVGCVVKRCGFKVSLAL
jgi:hypothetical protein